MKFTVYRAGHPLVFDIADHDIGSFVGRVCEILDSADFLPTTPEASIALAPFSKAYHQAEPSASAVHADSADVIDIDSLPLQRDCSRLPHCPLSEPPINRHNWVHETHMVLRRRIVFVCSKCFRFATYSVAKLQQPCFNKIPAAGIRVLSRWERGPKHRNDMLWHAASRTFSAGEIWRGR